MNLRSRNLIFVKFAALLIVTLVVTTQALFAQRLRSFPDTQIPEQPPKFGHPEIRAPRSLRNIANKRYVQPELQSSATPNSPVRFGDGTSDLKRYHEERGERVKLDSPRNTIPFWSDGFTYQGLEFNYKMVGTDPQKGSTTTVIPTVIIPLRFVFPDGQVFDASTDIMDGQTPLQGIVNSPIFQNYHFVLGGTDVGTTQYADAFQRANFWDSISTRAGNYHVLLRPTVLPVQTIIVPAGLGAYYYDSTANITFPVLNFDFLTSQEYSIRTTLNVPAGSLPITVWGRVWSDSPYAPGVPAIGGWHGAQANNGGVLTYIGISYNPRETAPFADVYPLSHEVVEWMDDPFSDNYTPGWNYPFIPPDRRCDSGGLNHGLLEVADPVEFFLESAITLPGTSFDYHVTEAMFIDYYTRASASRSVNGQYSMFTIGAPFGLVSEPSSECVGSVQVEQHFIDVPGSISTSARGINNQEDVVGTYLDQQNHIRGFKWNHGSFSAIDFPGARRTLPSKINDSGDIVGYFRDAVNRQHGFLYTKGQWIQIDFPGSPNTIALGINSRSQIVGEYFDPVQLLLRGFILTNGQFTPVDTPFAQNCGLNGINDAGSLVGSTWNDTSNGSYLGFLSKNDQFSLVNMPNAQFNFAQSVNSSDMIAGNFDNGDGYSSGFVRLFADLHEVNGNQTVSFVYGNNDLNQIVGEGYDFNTGRWRGYIGELPLKQNVH